MSEFLRDLRSGKDRKWLEREKKAETIELRTTYSDRLGRRTGSEIDTISDQSIEIYKLYREKISHEDHLTNFRMSWFVALQAFLFSAFALSLGRNTGNIHAIPTILFGLVGAFSCLATWVSVWAANRAILKTREK
jgi:hypothetical protein